MSDALCIPMPHRPTPRVVASMTHRAMIVVTAALISIAFSACAVAAPVNMLYAETPRQESAVSDAALQPLVPAGYAITDKISIQLDGVGPRELAVVMCADDASQTNADWWIRYTGPSKVLILNEAGPSQTTLGEFELKGCAPPAGQGIASPFFTEDLNADGIPELFIRTKEYAGGSGGWTHVSCIKWSEGIFKRAGIFGVAELGGMYLLDNWVRTPGREVVLMHHIWADGEAHFAPHRYRAQTYGWSNGYYVVLGEIYTYDKYSQPEDAFTNLVRYVWNKGVYQRLPRGY